MKGEKKYHHLKYVHFQETNQKLENIYLHSRTTFHNFALIIQTSWAETIAKPILENMLGFIHSWMNKTKKNM